MEKRSMMFDLTKPPLFTIYDYSGKMYREVYMSEDENYPKYETPSKPVQINTREKRLIWDEKNKLLKNLNSYQTKNKYFKANNMDELENEKKKLEKETNWKIRVLQYEHDLNEERKMKKIREGEEKAELIEVAEALIKLSKSNEKFEKKTKKTKTLIETPVRKSRRIQEQNKQE